MYEDAFTSLPFRKDEELKILDVGCGLGFLSCLSAEFYPKAQITAFDTFADQSLNASNLQKAENNARILGFSNRIHFEKGNLLTFTTSENFDIFVSNLVFHNLGRKRFEAYSRLSSWANVGSYIVMGDWFFSLKTDLKRLSKLFTVLDQMKASGHYTFLIMMKTRNS